MLETHLTALEDLIQDSVAALYQTPVMVYGELNTWAIPDPTGALAVDPDRDNLHTQVREAQRLIDRFRYETDDVPLLEQVSSVLRRMDDLQHAYDVWADRL